MFSPIQDCPYDYYLFPILFLVCVITFLSPPSIKCQTIAVPVFFPRLSDSVDVTELHAKFTAQ